MAPEFDIFHENMTKNRDDVIIGRVEGNINEDISMIYEVYSYPRIVIFEPNSVDVKADYTGRRTASAMENWMEKVAPIIKINKNEEKIKEKKEENIEQQKEEKIKEKDESKNQQKNTEELEYVRRELDNMKNKVLSLEQEIDNLKTYSKKLNSELELAKAAKMNNTIKESENGKKDEKEENNLSDELKLKLTELNEKKKKILETYSFGELVLFFCIFLFFIGAIITIKKIFFANKKHILPVLEHPKV